MFTGNIALHCPESGWPVQVGVVSGVCLIAHGSFANLLMCLLLVISEGVPHPFNMRSYYKYQGVLG